MNQFCASMLQPALVSSLTSSWCGTVSNALERSMRSAPTISPASTDLIHPSKAEMSANSQLDLLLKPNCSGGIINLLSQYWYSCAAAIFSHTLARIGRIEMG